MAASCTVPAQFRGHGEPSPSSHSSTSAQGINSVFHGTGMVRRHQPALCDQPPAERWDFALSHDQLLDRAGAFAKQDPIAESPKPRPNSEQSTPAVTSDWRAAFLEGDNDPQHASNAYPESDAGCSSDYARPPRLPLTESIRPRAQPLDSAASLAAELDQLELQEQAVWQRLVDRSANLAVELAAVDEHLVPRWATIGEEMAERAEKLREEQLSRLIESPAMLDLYWRERFRTQEQQWQAKVDKLEGQVALLRRRTNSMPRRLSLTSPRGHETMSDASHHGRNSPRHSNIGDMSRLSPHRDPAGGHARLGIDVADADGTGVRVVHARGAAQASGLRPGDIVKGLRCIASTHNVAAFRQAAASLPPSSRIMLTVQRNGEEKRLTFIS